MPFADIVWTHIFRQEGAERSVQAARSVEQANASLERRTAHLGATTQAAAQKHAQAAARIAGSTRQAQKSVGGSMEELAQTGFRLTFYAITALAAGRALVRAIFIQGMAKAASDFEIALNRVADASDLSTRRTAELSQSLLEQAAIIGHNATAVARLYGELRVLGRSAEQSKAMMQSFGMMADATGEDLEQLGAGTARLMRLWRISADDTATISAMLVRSAHLAGRSLATEMIPQLEGASRWANALNLPLSQLLTLITLAGRAGPEALQAIEPFLRMLYQATGKRGLPPGFKLLPFISRAMATKETRELLREALGTRGVQVLEDIALMAPEELAALEADLMSLRDPAKAAQFLLAKTGEQMWLLDRAAKKLSGELNVLWTSFGRGVTGPLALSTHAIRNVVSVLNALPMPLKAAISSVFLFTSSIAALTGGIFVVAGVLGVILNRLADLTQQLAKSNRQLSTWGDLFRAVRGMTMASNLQDAMTGLKGFGALLGSTLRFLWPFIAAVGLAAFVMGQNKEELQKTSPVLAHVRDALESIFGSLFGVISAGKVLVTFFKHVLTILAEPVLTGIAEGVALVVYPLTLLAEILRSITQMIDNLSKSMGKFGEENKWLFDILKGITEIFMGLPLKFIGWMIGISFAVKTLVALFTSLKTTLLFIWGLLAKGVFAWGAPMLGRMIGWLLPASVLARGAIGGTADKVPRLFNWLGLTLNASLERILKALVGISRLLTVQTARGGLEMLKGIGVFLLGLFARGFGGIGRFFLWFYRISQAFAWGLAGRGWARPGQTLPLPFDYRPLKAGTPILKSATPLLEAVRRKPTFREIQQLAQGRLKELAGWTMRTFGSRMGIVAGALRGGPGLFGRIPLLGPLISFIIDMLSGRSLTGSLGGAVGLALGALAGGTIAGPLGALLVGWGGHALGSWLADMAESAGKTMPAAGLAESVGRTTLMPAIVGGSMKNDITINVQTSGTTQEQAEMIARQTYKRLRELEKEYFHEFVERDRVSNRGFGVVR